MRRRPQASRREALNLSIETDLRQLIDRAPDAAGRNRRDFVLEAARRAAEDTLLDRSVIPLNPKTHRRFVARLDAPPRPNKRLVKTMRTPAPWE
jgi:uncharacterized protein (DUF1778 family)